MEDVKLKQQICLWNMNQQEARARGGGDPGAGLMDGASAL
jgi:hypothetical protein